MTLSSRILAVQEVQSGERVGYGGTFEATRPSRIGIVGLRLCRRLSARHAPTGTPILVNGRRTTTVGRVSMDMLACDLTEIPEAGVDSPVVLWGGHARRRSRRHRGTISCRLFCALARRVPVVEVG